MEGIVVEWNDDRGYGFILSPVSHQRLFFHISSVNSNRRPNVNDEVEFVIGEDRRGEACAVDVRLEEVLTLSFSFSLIFGITFLTVLVSSYFILGLDILFVAAYFGMSFFTFMLYMLDKNAAENNEWRTPELTLHMFALFCGWPGALIAQQTLRHKSVKQPFKAILWLTITLNSVIFLLLLTPEGLGYFDHFIYKLGLLSDAIISEV
ncbi:DNA-binding protein [Vibrio inusitatus NBRC 102082]|uniref:DNA-binding protein n=1 Tax=Vibrio inusitatus NBRC 102082 TaxID=1219070 RepID=A0A4Y3HWS2_9VIBR|nr:cold shock and DUF1294 domain-containing protein [Vibrio inusitatus]GEA51468.1 DNA-binding protein [Vibrio inusitatus NBRC 102082]